MFGSGRPQTPPNQRLYFCFRPVDRLGHPCVLAAQDPGACEEKPPGSQDASTWRICMSSLCSQQIHSTFIIIYPPPQRKTLQRIYKGEHLQVGGTRGPRAQVRNVRRPLLPTPPPWGLALGTELLPRGHQATEGSWTTLDQRARAARGSEDHAVWGCTPGL